MIKSFECAETELIFRQEKSRRLPLEIQKRALIKLLMIDAATTEDNFQIPPSNRFERLQGDMSGHYSIRINDQWRIRFRFDGGDTYDVAILDYHQEKRYGSV